MQALALAWLLQVQEPAAVRPQQLLQHLHALAVTDDMKHKLARLQDALAGMVGGCVAMSWQTCSGARRRSALEGLLDAPWML